MDKFTRCKLRVEGILLQDVVGVLWALHPLYGSPDRTQQAADMDLRLVRSETPNGFYSRMYMTGRYWRFWIDLRNEGTNVNEHARSYPDEYAKLVFYHGMFHFFGDYFFEGEWMDFEKDMLTAKMIGMIPPLPDWVVD